MFRVNPYLEVLLHNVSVPAALLDNPALTLLPLPEHEQDPRPVPRLPLSRAPRPPDGVATLTVTDRRRDEHQQVDRPAVVAAAAELRLVEDVPELVRVRLRPLVLGPERRQGPPGRRSRRVN